VTELLPYKLDPEFTPNATLSAPCNVTPEFNQ
jgi:hypothetical protein